MDSLTHLAVGACIGDLFLGHRIGKKAMIYGALASSLPDIDFLAGLWLSPTAILLAHRGITHSLLFALAAVLAMAFLFRHRHRVEKIPVSVWLVFLGTEILIHLFLDAFNAYGVGWFEPFSSYRVSFNTIFVADPFFSVWPGIAACLLLVWKKSNANRKKIARWGLLLPSLYLLYCVNNKISTDRMVRHSLSNQDIGYRSFITTPAPFNNWLWYAVVRGDSGYYTAYRSVFDHDTAIKFTYTPRNDNLLLRFSGRSDFEQLLRFSQGYYTSDSSANGIEFNVLRFGQIMGWENPHAPFVFHYYLQRTDENLMLVQRGRFEGWNRRTVRTFLKRIRGN